MSLLDDKVKKQLQEALKPMVNNVNLVLFTQTLECNTCRDTHLFLGEISELSDKLTLTVWNFQTDKDKAEQYGVDKIPAIVVLDSENRDHGIKFYGLPGGYEINSFIRIILEMSGLKEQLPDDMMKRIQGIKKDIHIQVFISLTCPYCPDAVSAAHRLALESEHIKADMVESSTFVPLAIKFNVSSVPKTVINGTQEFVGTNPLGKVLDFIEKV